VSAGLGQGGSKVFFSEEKKQKTFANSDPGAACHVRDSTGKVFWFFSSEKNAFLLPPQCSIITDRY
jgi:hypothetical protein